MQSGEFAILDCCRQFPTKRIRSLEEVGEKSSSSHVELNLTTESLVSGSRESHVSFTSCSFSLSAMIDCMQRVLTVNDFLF